VVLKVVLDGLEYHSGSALAGAASSGGVLRRVSLRLGECHPPGNAEVRWGGPTSVVSSRADAPSRGVRRRSSEGPSRTIPVVRSGPVPTIEHGDFEWDDAKAAANEKKHGVTFVEAATVFDDADFLVNVDPRDSARFIAVGFSGAARVLVVVHATRAERIRLISARRATLPEDRLYAERRER
jgi:uncharacterized DUF497 family protein